MSAVVEPGIYELQCSHPTLAEGRSVRLIANISKVEPVFEGSGRICRGWILIGEDRDVDLMRGAKSSFHFCPRANCSTELAGWHVKKHRLVTQEQVQRSTHWGRALATRLGRAEEVRAEFRERGHVTEDLVVGRKAAAEPTVFGDGINEVDLSGDTNESADAIQTAMVEHVAMWSDEQLRKLPRPALLKIIGDSRVDPSDVNRAIACLSVGVPVKPVPEPEVAKPDPIEALSKVLQSFMSKRERRAQGSDSDSDDPPVDRGASVREKLLKLHTKKSGLLTKQVIKDIYLTSGAAWGGADKFSNLSTLHLTDMPALFRTYTGRGAIASGTNLRNKRELLTLATALDEMILGNTEGAADVLVQRIKALELADAEGSWDRAQHVELITPMSGMLATRMEVLGAAKEARAEARADTRKQGDRFKPTHRGPKKPPAAAAGASDPP